MLSLLEMSVTGGILAAVAVIIRAVAVNRLPKKVFLAFWAAVLCCLFFPFRIPSPVSVYAAVPSDAIRRPGVLLGNAATAPAQDAPSSPSPCWCGPGWPCCWPWPFSSPICAPAPATAPLCRWSTPS